MINKFLVTIILFFVIIYSVKTDYAIFDIITFKNNSLNEQEYINYFYNNYNNIIYSKITLGPNKEKYIMEIKSDSIGFTIFNHNCDIPPIDNSKNTSYFPNLANSTTIDFIDDNETIIYGEYFTSILNNKIYIKTNEGEKQVDIDFVFSPRDDSNYTKNLILRPYTCFTLGFITAYIHGIEEIDKVDDYALNLIFQFKREKIISTYNWFIEYDSNNDENGKLILGIKPHNYNKDKYKEENERHINAIINKDKKIYWGIQVNEIFIKNGTDSTMLIKDYMTCSLEPSLGIIIGPVAYKLIMEDYLFKPLIEENKCFKSKNILDNYIIYYCKKGVKDFLKKSNYNNIYFLHRFNGITFELNYEDLFEEKGDYIYFKVFFNKEEADLWRLGKPFLRKYFFSYDLDGSSISFYNFGKTKKQNGKTINIILIVIIIVLIIICSILGFFIAKYLYAAKQKKKGTELMDNDDYDFGSLNSN